MDEQDQATLVPDNELEDAVTEAIKDGLRTGEPVERDNLVSGGFTFVPILDPEDTDTSPELRSTPIIDPPARISRTQALADVEWVLANWLPRVRSPEGVRTMGKYEAYGVAFDHVDKRRVTLTEVCEIAVRHGHDEGIIRMRRRDWNAMRITEGCGGWNLIHSDKNKYLPYSRNRSVLPLGVNEDDYQELLETGLIYGKHGNKLYIVGVAGQPRAGFDPFRC